MDKKKMIPIFSKYAPTLFPPYTVFPVIVFSYVSPANPSSTAQRLASVLGQERYAALSTVSKLQQENIADLRKKIATVTRATANLAQQSILKTVDLEEMGSPGGRLPWDGSVSPTARGGGSWSPRR